MFRRPLAAMTAAAVLVSNAFAAGDAFVCPEEPAREASVAVVDSELFTRPESGVPAAKRTASGLYLTATDAYEMVSETPDAVLFLDVRTRGELQFIGMPTLVDAHVPFLVETSPPQWDESNATFKLASNANFVADVDARLGRKHLTRDDVVIVICQGGLRAARAATALTQAGYRKVYTVVDGFEGDPAPDGLHRGERIVNGWRNAGLPWTARLDRSKMYGLD